MALLHLLHLETHPLPPRVVPPPPLPPERQRNTMKKVKYRGGVWNKLA